MPKRSRRAAPSVLSRAQYRQTADEHSLQVGVLEFLALNKRPEVYFFAIPNAGKRSWYAAARMNAEGMRAGVADLCIMLPGGRVAWLEMKTTKGRQTIEQLAFESVCSTLGHPYLLVRTFEGAVHALRHWGALKGD